LQSGFSSSGPQRVLGSLGVWTESEPEVSLEPGALPRSLSGVTVHATLVDLG